MRYRDLGRFASRARRAFGAGVVSSIFLLPSVAANAATETVIYSFRGGSDGGNPVSAPIVVAGTLYGTTYEGGAYGNGTLFSIDPSGGQETALYSFQKNGTDGYFPLVSPVRASGLLYGTTANGGTFSGGAVFSIDPKTNAETVVYSFCGQGACVDGRYPAAPLTAASGNLYGTTFEGGQYRRGEVFSINPTTGSESVVYSFCAKYPACADGGKPHAGVIEVNGTLYGTNQVGGGSKNLGTVYSLDPATGIESVLHSFVGADGASPDAPLIDVKGTLYGTTTGGGAYGMGTVFAIDLKTGAESVIHSFDNNGQDGFGPEAGLIEMKGMLYGTTTGGGSSNGGTAYAIDPANGTETVLYSFCGHKNCADGAQPEAALLDVGGKLYGTTYAGGASGCGTLFAIKP